MSTRRRTRVEQETVIRWNAAEDHAELWTAYPADARRWQRRGFSVEEVRTPAGIVTGWRSRCPVGAIRYRRLTGSGEIERRVRPAREGAAVPLKRAV